MGCATHSEGVERADSHDSSASLIEFYTAQLIVHRMVETTALSGYVS